MQTAAFDAEAHNAFIDRPLMRCAAPIQGSRRYGLSCLTMRAIERSWLLTAGSAY